MLPAAEVEFDGQSEQEAGPKPALYWLIIHSVHAPPFSPVYPAGQTHAVTAVLFTGETEFAGQAAQPPVPDSYVPAGQTQ